MIFKFSGLLFILSALIGAISGMSGEGSFNASTGVLKAFNSSTPVENTGSVEKNTVVPDTSVSIIIQNDSEVKASNMSSQTMASTKALPTTSQTSVIPEQSTTSPKPSTEPPTTSWIVTDEKTKAICIIAEMSMQVNVTYPAKTKETNNAMIPIPKNSTASGSCSSQPETLILSWGPGHNLTINFEKNESAKNFYISGLTLNVNATVFNDVKENVQFMQYSNDQKEFSTPLKMSYKCDKVQTINLNSSDSKLNAVLSLKDTQFEAYRNKSKPEFSEGQYCAAFDTPDVVPIAVGCALAILVLIVLVAYLIGRKRSQNVGYLSM